MSAPMLTAAQRLAQLGLAVHWLRGPSGGSPDGRGKAPIDKGWQLRPWQSPQQLAATYRPGLNVGIHTGGVVGARAPVVVVDYDDEKAERWCRENLPPTPLEAVSSKGGHLYYLRPCNEVSVPCRARVGGMALEIRADGGNIVAPPSVHPSGVVYQWVGAPGPGMENEMPVYQMHWLPVARSMAAPAAQRSERSGHEVDGLRRARAYVRSVPGAISGQGGSLATFKVAVALVRGFALTEQDALEVLLQDFNLRCEPPWSEPELLHKLRYARASGRVEIGSLLAVQR